MPQTVIKQLADWLDERCLFLRNLEKEARRVLQEDGDTEKYKALMGQKAMFLQALPEEADKRLDAVPEAVGDMVAGRLEAFSASASQALRIDSVFYMYALLYPDDHKAGEPNNLELLAAEVAALAGK